MRQKMSKILAFLLVVVMVFSCTVTTNADQADTENETETAAVTDAQETGSSPAAAQTETAAQTEEAVQTDSRQESETAAALTESDQDAQNAAEVTVTTETEEETESSAREMSPRRAPGDSNDISNTAVDSVTIKSSSGNTIDHVTSYTQFKVDVAFSEGGKSLDIKSGDQIFVSWTAPAGITLEGYQSTFDIYPDNDTTKPAMATAEVTKTGVTITFNDSVNNLQQVKGSCYFTINVTGANTTDNHNATITSGTQSGTVRVDDSSGPSVIGFATKDGSQVTDGTGRIRWVIRINRQWASNLDTSQNIVITDTLPDTETFESFANYAWWYKADATHSDGQWATVAKTLDGEMPFNTGSRSMKIEGQKITITIPASDLNHVQTDGSVVPVCGEIDFYTTTTAAAGSKVNNEANVTYYDDTSTTQPKSTTATAYATVADQGGTISGVPQGQIEIHKQIKGTTAPVAGVKFHIQKITGENDETPDSSWTPIDITTDSDGVAKTGEGACPDGWYLITELSGPDWIVIPSNSGIKVQMGGTAGVKKIVEDEVKTTDVKATKKWLKADGQTADSGDHPEIYFQLYRQVSGGDAEKVGDPKLVGTGSTVEVDWGQLPQYDNSGKEYTYSVKEVDAQGNDYTPEGYKKTENGLTVTNRKLISIQVNKQWLGDPAESATVHLFENGVEIKSVTLTEEMNWEYTFEDLDQVDSEGDEIEYTLTEDAIDGYTSKITGDMQNGFTVTNTKNTSITATKEWTQADGTTPDTGDHPTVYFRLYRNGTALTDDDLPDDQSAIKAVVTASGESSAEVTWEKLPQYDDSANVYTYTVKEVDADGNDYAPDGYTKSEDALKVTNTRNEGSRDVSASLTLKKTDSNGEALDGASFTLYDGQDEVKTYTAGEATISSDDLKAALGDADSKTFSLKETKAPDGYQLSTDTYEITLTRTVSHAWEGEGTDRKYMTINTYTLTCADAEDGTITVADAPVTGERDVPASLTLKKTDNNGNALDGATFTLYDGETAVKTYENVGEAAISSDDLKAALGDADSKTFTLKETKAPDGYQAGTKEYSITLTKKTEQKWEGEGADRKYMTVITYTLTSDDAKDGTITVPNTPVKTKVIKKVTRNGKIVKTGDTSHLVLWTILLVLSAGVIITVLVRRRKKSR